MGKVVSQEELSKNKDKYEVVENWDDGYVFVKTKKRRYVDNISSSNRTPGLPE